MDNRQVDFSADEVLRDPYPSYDTLRDTAPVLWDDVQQAWLVVGYPEARRLALDPRLSADADMTPFVEGLQERHSDVAKKLKEHFESWMLFSDDPRHADLRSLIAPAMSTAVVSPYRQPLRDRARQLLASTGPDLDVVDDYAVPLSRLSLAQVLGVPEALLTDGARWAYELVEFVNIDLDEAQAVRTAGVVDEMGDFLDELAAGRPVPGSVGAVVARALRDGRLDRCDAVGIIGQMVSGVMGAQPYLVGNAVIPLWGTDTGRATARTAPVADIVAEALRFDSPFLIVPRTATGDITVGPATIRAGDRVGILLGAVNRDPRSFGCPHAFDARQQRKPHMSFGTGAHYCLGSSMVRVYTEVALRELLDAYPPATTTVRSGPHRPYFGLRAPRDVRLRRTRTEGG